MDFVKFTTDKIASKLSSYVPQNQKVRVIVFCSCLDHGRDRVNLSFLKYFGVVTEEFNIFMGGSAVDILSDLYDFDGLTIVFESVPIDEHLSKDTVAQSEHYISISRISGKDQRLINEQTEKISDYFKKNQHEYPGGYVYISGFGIMMSSAGHDLLPETEFLPWYLEVDNKSSSCHIVRQPELNLLMQKMTEAEPLIHNLDNYLDEMHNLESELDG